MSNIFMTFICMNMLHVKQEICDKQRRMNQVNDENNDTKIISFRNCTQDIKVLAENSRLFTIDT